MPLAPLISAMKHEVHLQRQTRLIRWLKLLFVERMMLIQRMPQPLEKSYQAQQRLRDVVQSQPVLVQISAARRLRDHAERLARQAGDEQVGASHVEAAGREMGWEVMA